MSLICVPHIKSRHLPPLLFDTSPPTVSPVSFCHTQLFRILCPPLFFFVVVCHFPIEQLTCIKCATLKMLISSLISIIFIYFVLSQISAKILIWKLFHKLNQMCKIFSCCCNESSHEKN